MNLPATTANDLVHRFLFEQLDIRGQVVRLGPMWQHMLEGRKYPEPVIHLFGELMAVGVLIGTGLKHPGRVTLQIQGNGPIDLAVVECAHDLKMRGMVRVGARLEEQLAKLVRKNEMNALPDASVELVTSGHANLAQVLGERISFSDLVGTGKLAISIDNQLTGQIYQSLVPLDGLTVAECFESYFDQSEQVPTHLWLAANETAVGAMLLQKMPNADKRDADGWARVDQLASTVAAAELTGLAAEPLLRRLFNEEDVRLQPARTVSNGCKRDLSKVEAMLRSLGRKELDSTLVEHGEIVVRDDMCNFEYRFDANDVARLFDATEKTEQQTEPKQSDNNKAPPTRH